MFSGNTKTWPEGIVVEVLLGRASHPALERDPDALASIRSLERLHLARGRGERREVGPRLQRPAGDARRGQSLIVWAINEGRQCARMVDRYLRA